jgi:hypothetical protein
MIIPTTPIGPTLASEIVSLARNDEKSGGHEWCRKKDLDSLLLVCRSIARA